MRISGSTTGREYARKFSALLAFVPHVAGRERAKLTRFVEGLNEEFYQSVLTSKPSSYAEAVDTAIHIEEGMRSRRNRRAQVAQAVQSGRPVGQGAQSSQSSQSAHFPQQQQQPVAQQSGRGRFRPRGQQFKKKSGSGSSGSGSSSSSGSRTEFCGFCGGKHSSTLCVGVQSSCNLCGSTGIFARVCPSVGSQQAAAQPQGLGVSLGAVRSSFSSPVLVRLRLGRFSSLALRVLGSRLSLSCWDPDHAPRRGSGRTEKSCPGDDQYDKTIQYDIHRAFRICYLAGNLCLDPTGIARTPALHGRLRYITPIRSTTGDGIPSSACTRRRDEICANGFSS
ncbi:hypothetical protein F511_22821 [Dorcoceras hygrometricum]|uniref:Retrotransposon gag domain-containing protein n=1 Tax=Dorcoceras hygrometricum TaxID=472368 RepID=A0A2Z7ALS5_9LAMI|nr:hypothetical protein F511_22821 [Dorcoceras hygrometricum]